MGAGSTPPGWYPDVERAGGERYWDGFAWTENRRAGSQPDPAWGQSPPGYAQPAAYGAPQGYQAYGTGFGQVYPRSSNAGLALGLAIAGLFCCGLIAIPGLIMGRSEVKAVDAGQADPSNRGLALAAYIVGGIAVGIYLLLALVYVVAFIFAIGTA